MHIFFMIAYLSKSRKINYRYRRSLLLQFISITTDDATFCIFELEKWNILLNT